jgi:hypothetical protein
VDDETLMALRADALFVHDARGRMLTTHEPREDARRPAPRLFVGSSAAGCVMRVGASEPDALAREVDTLLAGYRPAGDLRLPQPLHVAIRAALERHAPVAEVSCGPAYRFPQEIAVPNGVVRLTFTNRELARETFPWLADEIEDWQPCHAIIEDGAAVSVCFSSRIQTAVVEAGVDTLEGFRGRGHAVAVTAAWATAVRSSGRMPVYSTGWENLASQGVARRLGLLYVGEDASWA